MNHLHVGVRSCHILARNGTLSVLTFSNACFSMSPAVSAAGEVTLKTDNDPCTILFHYHKDGSYQPIMDLGSRQRSASDSSNIQEAPLHSFSGF